MSLLLSQCLLAFCLVQAGRYRRRLKSGCVAHFFQNPPRGVDRTCKLAEIWHVPLHVSFVGFQDFFHVQ